MYGRNGGNLKLAELSEQHGGYPPDDIWIYAFGIAQEQGGSNFNYAITTAFNAWEKQKSGIGKTGYKKHQNAAGGDKYAVSMGDAGELK